MLIQETGQGHNSASATPLLSWLAERGQICLGAFRSIDKRFFMFNFFILAHPFAIQSECLCGFRAIQLVSQPFTTTTMLLLYIACKAHYKLAIFVWEWCGVGRIVLSYG